MAVTTTSKRLEKEVIQKAYGKYQENFKHSHKKRIVWKHGPS